MNPLIQLNRQLQYLFIALLLACFAIMQSAIAVTPEPDGGYPNGNTAEEDNALLDLDTGTPTPTSSFPLKKSANGRYLIYQDGTPFFLLGDSAWYLPVQGTNADIDTYLADRAAKGFNTVLVQIIDNHYADKAPNNIDGVAPFTTPGNFSTANPAYFTRIDYILTQANNRGMLVIVFPLFLGYNCGSDGWAKQVLADTTPHIQQYAQFLGNRYKNFGNIIWVMGGDTDVTCASGLAAKVDAFATALVAADPNHLVTSHNNGNEAVTPWLPTVPSWLNLNNVYGPSPLTFTQGQTAYNRTPTRPFFLIESYYENDGHGLTRKQLRNQEYWALLSGCAGFMFGNCPMWGAGSAVTHTKCPSVSADWRLHLNSPGAQDITRLKNLFTSVTWQTLVPDFTHTTVTAGYGSGATTVTTSRASDGSFVISYLPTVSGITVNMSKLTGKSVAARWYDPSDDVYSTVSGSPFTNTGTHVFTPTGNNSSGGSDWLLLLQSTSVPTATPTPPSPTATPPTETPPPGATETPDADKERLSRS